MESKSPVRVVKQRQNYFLKHHYEEKADFTKNFGLSFQPHEIRIRGVTCSSAKYPVHFEVTDPDDLNAPFYMLGLVRDERAYTLYMEGIGDICSFTEKSDKVVDYTFTVRNAIDGQQNFQIRNTSGTARIPAKYLITYGVLPAPPPSEILPVDLVIHMEFIEYA